MPLELTPRMWSLSSSWDNLPDRIPIEGDKVVIESGWNMIFDMETTPDLDSIQINGKLTILSGKDREIRTHSLWIRAGTLEIGTENAPYEDKMYITLLGDNTEKYWAFTPGIEAGNKNLVVTGTLNMYGLPRDAKSRLMNTVVPR